MTTKANAILHVGISVADLERSVAWYAKNFGFTEVKRFVKNEREIRAAVMQLGDATLEIIAPFRPEPAPPRATSLTEQLRRTGVNHIAIRVDDPAACYNRLADAGCAMLSPLIEGRFFFCADPDGTVLEIKNG